MDKSLDDIISSKPRVGRGGRRRAVGGARQQLLGKTNVETPANRARKAAAPKATAVVSQQIAEKIMVSGLPVDVNEAQIRELFATTVGPLKEVQLVYNAHGKWNGSATVVFSRKGDGSKAYEQYNNRLIDGKKPLKIELMFDPAKAAPAATLASRVAPAAKRTANGPAPMEGVQRTGVRGRRGRAPRAKRAPRPAKTAEDLDAEMEDYTASTSAPAAAVPAAGA